MDAAATSFSLSFDKFVARPCTSTSIKFNEMRFMVMRLHTIEELLFHELCNYESVTQRTAFGPSKARSKGNLTSGVASGSHATRDGIFQEILRNLRIRSASCFSGSRK